MQHALITGLASTELTPDERRFLRETRPCGIILFSRNCQSAGQIRALVAAGREAIGSGETLVLVIWATPTVPGSITNTVTVTSSTPDVDPSGTNRTAQALCSG